MRVEHAEKVSAKETDLGDRALLVVGGALGTLSQAVEVDESVGERSLDVVEEDIGLGSLLLVVLELEDTLSGLGLALKVSREGLDETSDVLDVDGIDVGVSSVKSVDVSETTTSGNLDEVFEVLEVDLAGADLDSVESVDTNLAILDASKMVLLSSRKSSIDRGRVGHGDRSEDQDKRRRESHREEILCEGKDMGVDLKIVVKIRRFPTKD